MAQQDQPFHVGARVGDLDRTALCDRKRKCARESSLHRAASTDCAPAVVRSREQPLLEGVCDVGTARKGSAAACIGQQLERRLAVTVFEILQWEAMAMDREQHLAARTGNECDCLRGIEPPGSAAGRRTDKKPVGALLSGRHESMSVKVARTPPSQFLRTRLAALDDYQQRKRRLGFLVAVFKRFDDDQASQMGALIAYYGFFSLFPLLLVFVTILGFVLEGSPSTQESVVHSTLSQFPVIGTQLQSNVHSLKGSVPALVIGLLGATLAGLGITGATQSAFNKVWEIPRARQLGFLAWRVRGVGLLIVFGLLSIVSTVAAGYVTAQTTGPVGVLAGVIVALAANLLLFFAVFRLLTSEEVETANLIPGVIVGAVLWQLLQHVGGFYVDHVVRHAKETSGLFAFVLGLLTWLYLGGQVTLIAAEVNVVRARRLWPRKLF
jgi:membrane protein